ncbi:MAG TPA: cytochrome c biogenesis protein ResB [Terriglobales bacterium]|nr:cytochrome c biogenesis protein ResB [Terriglobales bacterium]
MATKLRSSGRKLWQLFSSIKTGVILLIAVVIVSAAGTLILQRPATDADEMQRAYSPHVLRVLDAVGLTDVFHAWWFVLMLLLVSVAIVAASVERFPNAWRYFARPYKTTDESFRRVLATQKQIPIPNEETGLVAAERALHRMGFKPERLVGEEHISLFAERNRLSEMAVYIVHASLLLIFLGGIIDGLYGWRGFVSLNRGEQVNQIAVRDGGAKPLPFTLRCDGAGQENYQDGTPKRWWSKLVVLENGREALRKEIAVNDPLVYRGVRFYQASYGMTGKIDKLLLTANPVSGKGQPQEIALSSNETVQLDSDTSVQLARFIPDYVVRDGQIYARSEELQNPAVQLVVHSKKSGNSVDVWLPAIPELAKNEASPYSFDPRDLQMGYFTGLQASHEPGQWGVWSGCVLMGIGLVVAFYLVHMRIWVVPVRAARGSLVLWVGGTANKNREAFQQKFTNLMDEIQNELKRQRETESEACPAKHAISMAGN